MMIKHYYRKTKAPHHLLSLLQKKIECPITQLDTEICFNIELSEELTNEEETRLIWLLRETFDENSLSSISHLEDNNNNQGIILEFGPRMSFTSAFSSNATSICHECNLTKVKRLERSKRFHLYGDLQTKDILRIKKCLHDRMTEEEYKAPLENFNSGFQAKKNTNNSSPRRRTCGS